MFILVYFSTKSGILTGYDLYHFSLLNSKFRVPFIITMFTVSFYT